MDYETQATAVHRLSSSHRNILYGSRDLCSIKIGGGPILYRVYIKEWRGFKS